MGVFITIVRVLASCTSLAMILSPIPTIYKIHKNKSTGIASIVPLVAMFNNCHIVMMFGYLTKQYFPVFSTFVAGDFISLMYILTFYRYSHEKRKAHRVIAYIGIPLLIVSIYALLGGLGYTNQSRRIVGNFIGYYSITAAAVLYSAPLEKISLVLKHRSAVFLPIHMICAGTTNNLMWVIYGSLTSEWLIFAPNAFSFVVGVFQLGLYWVFHPSIHPLQVLPPHTLEEEIELELALGIPPPSASERKHSGSSQSPSFVLLASPLQQH